MVSRSSAASSQVLVAVRIHGGLHALGRFADRVGLPGAMSTAIPWTGERAPLHDRASTVLTHSMLMLAAAGGEACTDIEFLGSQGRLFGEVCSDSTLYRTIRGITPTILRVCSFRMPGIWHQWVGRWRSNDK